MQLPVLLITVENGIAQATMNRPQALNALTTEMIDSLSTILQQWEELAVRAVIIKGNGRAFCAGGDIKAAHAAGESAVPYFRKEYQLDRQLFHYRKPAVAFMDGITMGGGFGIAGACRFRVATENTVFAMPEVGIGFFPDIGAAYYLNHCPGQWGRYLAFTGNSIGPADMLMAGLATHYMPAARFAAVEERLARGGDVAETLAEFAAPPDDTDSVFDREREVIDECFAHPTMPKILAALRQDGSDFAHRTAATLFTRSPLSVLVTLEHLQRTVGEDFDTVIARDFALVQHFLQGRDFYEGVRAAVIDKDRQPRWQHVSLSDVSASDIAAYFEKAKSKLDDFIYILSS